MRSSITFRLRSTALLTVLFPVAVVHSRVVLAQGCTPSRFTSPSLGSLGGGGGDIYLNAGTWQVGYTYRYVSSNQLIIGRRARNDLAPGGIPSFVHTQSLNISVMYGITDQFAVTLNAPLSRGRLEQTYPDGQRHENTAAGVGELSLSASYWLRSAKALQPGGNVGIGFGVKAPTGTNEVMGKYWKADGTSIPFPVAPAIELGDGGWGYVVSAKGFRPVRERSYLYAGGTYTANPRKTTSVVRTPGSSLHWAVPDTWDANAGVSTLISSKLGLSVNLGAIVYGTPRRDLIGGRESGERLPAIAAYASPGIGITRGSHTLTFSVPVRAYMDFRPSYIDETAGAPGGGGLARRLILTSYSVRY